MKYIGTMLLIAVAIVFITLTNSQNTNSQEKLSCQDCEIDLGKDRPVIEQLLSQQFQTEQKIEQLEARLATEKLGSSHQVLAQVLAQASCSALNPTGWVFAVPRDCKNPPPLPICDEICKGLSGQDEQIAEKKVQLRAFNALHIFDTEPAKDFHNLGLKTYKYDTNDGRLTNYCGPNFCCCGADYPK